MSTKKINGYKIYLDEELGKGAYGGVFKGEQDHTHKECAVKIINKKNINSDPYLKSALFSQIQILSKLQSQNIVRLFDVMESHHNFYIVQELCDQDLDNYLKNQPNKIIPEQEAKRIITEICNGFLVLVRQGIVHRDIKPANILISDGKCKIGDFGFAKENIHKKIKNQSSVGTPLYMSIQILKGKSYTSKCDIWAIGCLFYEMLHGKTPWTAKNSYELVETILKKPLSINENLSQESKDFLYRTLQVFEKDRICWDDLFHHPIFQGIFMDYIDENKEFQNKYKNVMGDLRFKVNSQNIDIRKLWKSLGFEKDSELNFKECQTFLDAINPNMSKAEQSYFFEKMDSKGYGTLSLVSISDELEKFSISLTSKSKTALELRRTKSHKNHESDKQNIKEFENQFSKKIHDCFIRLNKILENKKFTLFQTFVAYDADKNGQLTVEEFSKILRRLDSSFTLEEIQAVFRLVDTDGSNTIDFEEFNSYYCKINGLAESMDLPKDYYQEKKERAILRHQLKQKMIN